MNVDILKVDGSASGRQIELQGDIFNIEPSEHCVYLAVKAYNAAQRQGTHDSKERNAVRGSTRKIKKQKGTGTARAGDIKNPLFRGGGRVFGPHPRSYEMKLNKKVKRKAKSSVFSSKNAEGNLTIVEDFTIEAPKTKDFVKILNDLQANKGRSLVIIGESSKNVFLSSRNIPHTTVSTFDSTNIFDMVNAHKIICTESAVKRIQEVLG